MLSRCITAVVVAAAVTLAGWFVFAAFTGATLIMFRTGSMAPTMPQGALAISVPVNAAEIAIGDVITIQRNGESLPVTHRVINISMPPESALEDAPDSAGSLRSIVMQGDDNAEPDAMPYVTDQARRVIVAVPAVGTLLMLAQSPIGMATLLLGAGATVTWAFWPRRATTSEADPHDHTTAVNTELARG